ncbi:MAG: YitT family protein [Clostridiaceae bacterium]|nr:YitT family protein [Clostridiaceae bacterium]
MGLKNKISVKQIIKELGADIVGGLLIAVGIYNFAISADFPLTGVSGICLILYRLFGLPIGLGTVILNIPIALLSFKLLGRSFFLRSIKSMLISSFIIDVIAPMLPVYNGDRMLAAICTGVLSGLGYALIYLSNSSTGGSDFIIMSVKSTKPYLSLGRISFFIDGVIILVGGFLFSDTDGIIYGILMAYVLSQIVDKVMYGIDRGKLALIVTGHGQTVAHEIELSSGRGATLLKATGSYSGLDKQVVMCACGNKEMFRVQRAARKADPLSFTVIVESSEVLGEGFKA